MPTGEGERPRGHSAEARLRDALETLPTVAWEGSAWRMHASRYAAEDTGGSYRVSGRYHRGGDYFEEAEVLYLATAPEVCLGELQRHLTAEALPRLNSFLLTELRVGLGAVLDLTLPDKAGLETEGLMRDTDYSLTQALGRPRGASGPRPSSYPPQPDWAPTWWSSRIVSAPIPSSKVPPAGHPGST